MWVVASVEFVRALLKFLIIIIGNLLGSESEKMLKTLLCWPITVFPFWEMPKNMMEQDKIKIGPVRKKFY